MVYFQTKLRNWIEFDKLNFSKLSGNSNAINILKNNEPNEPNEPSINEVD